MNNYCKNSTKSGCMGSDKSPDDSSSFQADKGDPWMIWKWPWQHKKSKFLLNHELETSKWYRMFSESVIEYVVQFNLIISESFVSCWYSRKTFFNTLSDYKINPINRPDFFCILHPVLKSEPEVNNEYNDLWSLSNLHQNLH